MIMRRFLSISAAFVLTVLLICSSVTAYAAENKNYIYNEYAEAVAAPAGYVCERIIFGNDVGVGAFKAPADVYVDSQNLIYIADSGNNRVVIINENYELVRIIDSVVLAGEQQSLASPSGVFARDGLVYICDTANARAIGVNENNEIVRSFYRPETSLLAEDFEFKPSKISVNSAGTVFMAVSGIYQGLLQYSNSDEFIGFFGANKVEVTAQVIIQNMWKNIFSDEQRESLVRTIPTEYTNLYIDKEDMILTATATVDTEQIKMLNSAGTNILVYPGSNSSLLQKGYNRSNFGDQQYNNIKGSPQKSVINDINIDENEILAVLDNKRGRIFVYDSEQNPLCIFGGKGNQKGNFKNAVSIDKCGTTYLVVDSDMNSVTVFAETEYMSLIRTALNEYSMGNYNESAEYWKKVIKKNSSLPVAYKGVGRALLINGEYEKAMEYLKIGDDRFYYSMAVERYRREFLRENFIWLLPVTVVTLFVFVKLIKLLKRAIINSGKKRGVKSE